MTSFSSLTIPLVKGIILPLVFMKSLNLLVWKQKLPIIGVCQLWRQLALGYVYNQAFFADYNLHIKNADNLRRRRGQYYYKRGVKNVKTALVSNVELLIALDQSYLIKDILIGVSYHRPNHLFFDEFFKILDQTKGNWTSVVDMYASAALLPEEQVIDYAYMDFKDKNHYLNRLMDYVTNDFPALNYVYFPCFPEITERLVNKKNIFYRDMYVLQSNMSYLCIYPYLPQNISVLDLTFDYTYAILRLPIIYAESLQQLSLQDLPSSFDWSCFSNPDIPYFTNVTFANLVKLHIFYRNNYDDDGNWLFDSPVPNNVSGVKLIFPKLSNLVVHGCSRHNRLLYADFPNKASKVIYSGSISSIALCQLIKIESKVLILDISFADKQNEALFYDTTNMLLAKEGVEVPPSLFLSNIKLSIDVDLIKWDFLNYLFIDSIIRFETLIMLLKRLPNLNWLILKTDAIQAILSTINVDFDSFKPADRFILSSSIRALALVCQFDAYKYPAFLDLVKLLIRYCPNLELMNMDYIFKDDIEIFIEKNISDFPCFQNLRINYEVFSEFIHYDLVSLE